MMADFYPRPPRGGRRNTSLRSGMRQQISIHALREEGDRTATRRSATQKISIHALREEGDEITTHCAEVRQDISIHALREEGDP